MPRPCRLYSATLLVLWTLLATSWAPRTNAQLPLKTAATVDASVNGPAAIDMADFDRDGDLDLVAGLAPSGVAGGVSWWAFDSGTGLWGTETAISLTFLEVVDVLAVDLDQDGDLDILAASQSGDEVAWFENQFGDASSWSGQKTVISGAGNAGGAAAVAVGDLDGDGDPDVVAAMEDADVVRWLENDGTPGNGGWILHTITASAFDGAAGVAVADVNRDGHLDVVATASLDDEVTWWQNDGSPQDNVGGDGNSWTERSIGSLNGARGVVVTDLDGDGDADVAAAGEVADEVVWFANTSGDGTTWSAADSVAMPDGPRHLAARDLDFDGDADLLGTGGAEDLFAWWENDGSGGWTEQVVSSTLGGARGAAVGDVDHDGDLDLVATGFGDDTILWWESDPISRRVEWVQNPLPGAVANSAVAADIDEDGDPDVVAGVDNDLSWFERHDDGTWTVHTIYCCGPDATDVGDMDRDGDLDIVGSVGTFIRWWENDGSPLDDSGGGLGTSWTVREISSGHGLIPGVHLADMDGDGFLDVVARIPGDDEVLWWENDGSPTDGVGGDGNSWTERVIDDITDNPRSALPADIDRDGDLDVVVVTQFAATPHKSWWENNGSGTGWTQNTIGSGNPLSAAVADLDGDGDLDVLTGAGGGASPGDLVLSENESPGDGSSWPAIPDTVGTFDSGELFPLTLALADFDLDGDPDPASAANGTANVYRWENDGTSSWVRDSLTGTAGDVEWIWAGDADGTRGPDLVIADKGNDTVVVWENQAAQGELAGTDISPAEVGDGVETALLRITARNLGDSGDADAAFSGLALLFEETAGDPLTTGEASALFDALRLYVDNGDDAFGAGDALVHSVVDPALTAGRAVVALPGELANLQIGPNGEREYFLIADMAADASVQGPDSFRVTIEPAASELGDAELDGPLTLLDPTDTATGTVAVGAPCWTLTRQGSCGAAPLANPANSASCPAGQFVEGEVIQLIANPNPGFDVDAWFGTNADGSTASTNQLTMPGANHVVTVTYGYIDDRVVSGVTVSGNENFFADSTLTVGPSFEVSGSGDATLRAPDAVILRNGFSVLDGGGLTVVNSAPPAACP